MDQNEAGSTTDPDPHSRMLLRTVSFTLQTVCWSIAGGINRRLTCFRMVHRVVCTLDRRLLSPSPSQLEPRRNILKQVNRQDMVLASYRTETF